MINLIIFIGKRSHGTWRILDQLKIRARLGVRAIFVVWPWKIFSVSVRYLFYHPMDEKIKTCPLRFPAKENPNMEKALFDWSIVLQSDVKAKYRLISRKFSSMKFFHPSVRLTNQNPSTFVTVRQTNQIALLPFVCCFCFVRSFSFQGHTRIVLTTLTPAPPSLAEESPATITALSHFPVFRLKKAFSNCLSRAYTLRRPKSKSPWQLVTYFT